MNAWIFDDFLKDPMKEREIALSQEYKTVEHNGLNYRGISIVEDPENVKRLGHRIRCKIGEHTVMYRRYLSDEKNETYIHSDVHIGNFTGILFLSMPEQCHGGTAFWKHKKYNWESHPTKEVLEIEGLEDRKELWDEIYQDGFDETKWDCLEIVPMKFNRLIVFSSSRYHSRFPQQAFGKDLSDSRLIKVFFCWAAK